MNPQLQLMLRQAMQYFQQGHLANAEQVLRSFMYLKPKDFDAEHLLAIVYASQGKHQNAIQHYKNALAIIPNNPSALSNYGSSLSAIGQNQQALIAFKKALKIYPNDPDFWCNTANTLCDLGRYEEALIHYERAITLNPAYSQAYTNYGKALFDLNRHAESLIYFDRALGIDPNSLECLVNKGEALRELKRFNEALACEKKVIEINPAYAEVWSNVGNILRQLKRYDEAIAHYDKAISLRPDYAEGWSNKGILLNQLKRYDEAIAHYDKAISLRPDYAEGWSNKGILLNQLKRYDEAIAHYDKALSLKPYIPMISGDLLHTRMKICSWSGLEGFLNKISKKVALNEEVASPFLPLALSGDSLLHKKWAEIFTQHKFPFNPLLGPLPKHSRGQRIRVGYFSADFHNHATAYLMAELFELHNKNQFELIGFSFGPSANDEMRKRLEGSFDQFIEVSGKSDMEIAKLSRDLNIDIAVDLKGFTEDSRTDIFSFRAAPIQVNYLGYPGTMGADYIDYIIADKTLIPVESQSCYQEKVIYLPNSYQVNDRKRLISDRKFSRQELGLPESGFVFCCFNNNFKIQPTTFASWMRILKAVEGSVLWLFQDNAWAVKNLKQEASNHGIDSNRLVFAERMSPSEHLARHRQADLFLDTLPYNAHTTSSDALWTGLPILTLIGESFAGRVTASLLNAIGLPELITHTSQEYESLAIELGEKPQKLAAIKKRLSQNLLSTPLFDTPLFTKSLEAAYIQIYERYQSDLGAEHISIA